MLCTVCSTEENVVEFPHIKAFIDHERSGHKTRPPKKKQQPPKNYPSATEMKAIKEKGQIPGRFSVALEKSAPAPPPPPIKIIKLKYAFEGECPDCRTPIKTLKVSFESKDAIIGFCINCNKELLKQFVIPINKQFPAKEKKKKTKNE